MRRRTRQACYELLAELLLYPEDRIEARLQALAKEVARAPAAIRGPILTLMASLEARDCERYLSVLELAPSCPLYLGYYLFDEPRNCRGAATSGRNRYMIELAGIYRHFGLEPTGAEVPDYLPLVLEFVSFSLDRPERNRTGIREMLIRDYIAPALAPMQARFRQAGGCWTLAIDALVAAIEAELRERPAARRRGRTGRSRRELPVIRFEAES